jgi:hypothetical protein
VFELSKWYADAVSAEGDVFIGYRARLHSGPLTIAYAAALDTSPRHSLSHTPLQVADREIHWQAPSLGVDARWQRTSSGIRASLYESPEGSVDWHCLIPKGEAAIGRTGQKPLRGLGYVEHLRVTVPPWRLPIRTLRWGRFLSPLHSLIWIDWQGDFSTRRVFLDGVAVAATVLDDEGLTLYDRSRVTFDRSLVLRKGKLGSTVLNAVPGLADVAPARIFALDECKWRSRGVLTRPGAEPDCGWCIHEVVTWP